MENTKYDDKFYRLPKRLFKEEQFRSMTNGAKTLYMILLDRRCLSECNGDAWRDEYGAIFIIFTIKEMMKLLCKVFLARKESATRSRESGLPTPLPPTSSIQLPVHHQMPRNALPAPLDQAEGSQISPP